MIKKRRLSIVDQEKEKPNKCRNKEHWSRFVQRMLDVCMRPFGRELQSPNELQLNNLLAQPKVSCASASPRFPMHGPSRVFFCTQSFPKHLQKSCGRRYINSESGVQCHITADVCVRDLERWLARPSDNLRGCTT